LTATDPNGCSGSKAYTIAICAQITLSPAALPDGTVGTAYSQTISASGGAGGYTFSVSSGALPSGLALASNTGVISGNPTTEGIFTFEITATDSGSCTGKKSYTIKICNIITLSPNSLPDGKVSQAYSTTVSVSGGIAPYTYSIISGALPNGLSLDVATGAISGTPTTQGNFSFTLKASDVNQCTGSKPYTITITPASCPTFTFSPAALPAGTVNVTYNQTISVTGGTSPYTYSISSGNLPNGITLSAGGSLTGTPTVVGNFNFTVKAVDKNYCTGTQNYSIAINCGSITVGPATLPDGYIGVAYNVQISVTGGVAPYTYTVTSGSLPGGMSLNTSTGILSGTPSSLGTFNFDVTVKDSNLCTGVKSYTLKILCGTITISPTGLPAGKVGTPYSQTLIATGGIAPYTFSLKSGSTLPAGLSLNPAGDITGTPTTAGTTNFIIRVDDANACFVEKQYSLVISPATCPAITLSPATLPNGNVNVAYNQTITATGGTAPYQFTVTTGSLPPGLTLTAGGVLSGIPTTTGTFNFTIQATDSVYCTGSKAYSVVINQACPTITIAPDKLPPAKVGTAYSQTITATGSTATPITFALTSGSLPPGLTLNGTSGVLSGTPTTAGTSNITITATDKNGCKGEKAYTLAVCSTITLSPSSLPNGTQGSAYSQTITATGSSATPFIFSVTSGSLPSGITLNPSTGVLSGTPTSTGTFTFTITATDTNGCSGMISYTLTIVSGCPTIVISPDTLPDGLVSNSYSQTISASGGTAPYTYAVTTGTLPAGLTLSSAGVLSGTPTTAGTSNITITATDQNGCTGSKQYSLTINVNPPVITDIRKMQDPFRLKILGYNFHPGCVVKINEVVVESAYKSPNKIIVKKGGVLKALLPKGVAVQITVENTDDGGVSEPRTFVR